jgi:enamine deaminase RidA (YjgF/YER057c/UK114 family)
MSSIDARTITNPRALHDPTPFGYSHAVSAPGELVFIAGQYASDASGSPVPGDFAAQVDLAFDRLESALAGVSLGPEHVVGLGSFVVDHDLAKLETLGKALHALPHSRLRSTGRYPHRRADPRADPQRRGRAGPAGDAVRGGRDRRTARPDGLTLDGPPSTVAADSLPVGGPTVRSPAVRDPTATRFCAPLVTPPPW